MRAYYLSVVLALVAGCAGDDDDDNGGGGGNGSGGTTSSAVGSIDCSDDDTNQTLSCSAPELCCALPNDDNHCATSCTSSVILGCDDDGDCPGNACCFSLSAGHGSECQSAGCEQGFSPMCSRSSECPSALPCCLTSVYNGVQVSVCVEEQSFPCP